MLGLATAGVWAWRTVGFQLSGFGRMVVCTEVQAFAKSLGCGALDPRRWVRCRM